MKGGNSNTGLIFAQKGSGGKETPDIINITCYYCEEKGHYAKTCPKKRDRRTGTYNHQGGMVVQKRR